MVRMRTMQWIILLYSIHPLLIYKSRYFMLAFTIGWQEHPDKIFLWIAINARSGFLEIAWKNAPVDNNDKIVLTRSEPSKLELITKSKELFTCTNEFLLNNTFDKIYSPSNPFMIYNNTDSIYCIPKNGSNGIVATIRPATNTEWFTTNIIFNYELSKNLTINTECYAYWVSYVDGDGNILAGGCMRIYPRWMQHMSSIVGSLRFCDLFIPGTHDSGSYQPDLNSHYNETIITKYTFTQSFNIYDQLMHGVRYLDIRVGYNSKSQDLFFVHHGVICQRPLLEIIDQVIQFVKLTNEIVIFALKEFPVGFGKNSNIHRKLVHYLQRNFGDYIVNASVTWQASLSHIWSSGQNVILAYDKSDIVSEFPDILFESVEQRWANTDDWKRLKHYLIDVNNQNVSLSGRPVADMAELTPDTWDIIFDIYKGLRSMADKINWRISNLYYEQLGATANIVAADFIHGTTLIDSAIEWNKRRSSPY